MVHFDLMSILERVQSRLGCLDRTLLVQKVNLAAI
jgi:hypothetical protein